MNTYVAKGEIPIEKNVIVTDEFGNKLTSTYPKRAKGLIKKGRAERVSENEIRLTDSSRLPYMNYKENNMNSFNNITDNNTAITVDPATGKVKENAFLKKAMNTAQKNNIPFYVACQYRMFCILMGRFSKEYIKKTFIVNDGMIVRTIVNLDYSNRTIHPHDKAEKDFALTLNSISSALTDLCNSYCEDNAVLEIISAAPTGENGIYRFEARGKFDTFTTTFSFIVNTEESGDLHTVVLKFVET